MRIVTSSLAAALLASASANAAPPVQSVNVVNTPTVNVANLPDRVPSRPYEIPKGPHKLRVERFDDQHDIEVLGGAERLAGLIHRKPGGDTADQDILVTKFTKMLRENV